MYACENTVKEASPEETNFYRDSRGVAELNLGDNAKAIEDFQAWVDWWNAYKNKQEKTKEWNTMMNRRIERRQRWIKNIKEGKLRTPKEIKQEMDLLWKEE